MAWISRVRVRFVAINKRKNANGRITGYTVQVSVPNPAGGRGTRHVVGTYRLRKDAEAAERDALSAIQRGTFNPAPKVDAPAIPTVAESVALWLNTKRMTIESNTANGYEAAIRIHLVPALGSIPIDQLTHDRIQQQVNTWRDAGMGAQLINRCVLILRATLARAVKAHQVPFNPCEGIEKPSVKKRRSLTIWTPQQQAAFLQAAQDDQLFPFWHLTLLEGMRRSEALGLRWSDVTWNADESKATVQITQTVVPDLGNGGKALIQPRTKTRSGARAVELTATTVAALKLHRDRQRFRRQAVGDMWGDHDLIVTNAIGDVVNPSTVKGNRNRLIERAGVPRMTTHDLRHIAATVMLASGAPGATVSHKIGHSSYATTVDLYGHLVSSDQALANDAIEAYLARGAGGSTGNGNT
jgi:integrase